MSLTQAGPQCDVCGNYILLDKSINPFQITGIKQTLHCHDKCKPLVYKAMNKKDISALPDGPLRKCFEYEYQRQNSITKVTPHPV